MASWGRIEAKQHAYALLVQARSFGFEVGQSLDGGNLREFRFDRLSSGRVNGGCVHATRIKIADLLFVGSRRGLARRRGFQDLPQILLIPVGKLAE